MQSFAPAQLDIDEDSLSYAVYSSGDFETQSPSSQSRSQSPPAPMLTPPTPPTPLMPLTPLTPPPRQTRQRRRERSGTASSAPAPSSTQSAAGNDCSFASLRASAWTSALRTAGDAASGAIAEIVRAPPGLCLDADGSAIFRRALELASPSEARLLAKSLHGLVLCAARSPHGSLALKELVYRLGSGDTRFVAQELARDARCISTSAFGSGLLCSLLEFSADDAATVTAVDRALDQDLATFCCHKFAHQVAVSVLSNGLPRQRAQILETLAVDPQRYARHRFASCVVEAALLHGDKDETSWLATKLMEQPGAMTALACHAFGTAVVRAIFEVPDAAVVDRASQYLSKSRRRVAKDRFGLELLREVGIRCDDLRSAAQQAKDAFAAENSGSFSPRATANLSVASLGGA